MRRGRGAQTNEGFAAADAGGFLEKDICCLTPLDAAYPARLRELAVPPSCIYVRGVLPPKERPSAAIIGARDSTDYGRELARTLGKLLSSAGIVVVSGMAYGIDSAAHRGVVDVRKADEGAAPTCAVMGCGLDQCYPKSHFLLYEDILQTGGCAISEYPLGAPPLKHHFIARNRIIAALADAVIVVEAKERSGTSVTVGHALELGKEIFAVPGRVTDRLSSGCNRLIREGARILTEPEDVLEFFHYKKENQAVLLEKEALALDENQALVYGLLDVTAEHMDALLARSKLPVQDALAALMELEILGLVECTRAGWYRKKLAQI